MHEFISYLWIACQSYKATKIDCLGNACHSYKAIPPNPSPQPYQCKIHDKRAAGALKIELRILKIFLPAAQNDHPILWIFVAPKARAKIWDFGAFIE